MSTAVLLQCNRSGIRTSTQIGMWLRVGSSANDTRSLVQF